jgi:cysteine-rich repeat protein
MRSAVSAFIAAIVGTTLFPACVDSYKDSTGTVDLKLVGQAPSGAVYRLRDATITVQGPTSMQVWSTEDDPNRTQLSANVEVGDYSALLGAGWRLERALGQSAQTVPAELASPNPTQFTVAAQARTAVPLRFKAFNEEIDLGQGYDIVLGVDECTSQDVCGDGMDNDCDGLIDCADSDCTAACAPVCGDGVVSGSEQCDDGNTASLDGCSSTCQLEPSEVEPNDDGSPAIGGKLLGNDFSSAAADGNGAFTGSVQRVAHISPAGDEDVFAFQNSATGPVGVKLDVWSSALGVGVPCGSSIDTALVIRDAAGTVLAQNDDRAGAADRCSGATFTLAAGQRIYVQILDFDDDSEIANYVLKATYLCGNGTIDAGEQCDDGNTANLDGCNNACQAEPSEVEPNEDGTPSTGGGTISGNDFAIAAADANGAFTGSMQLVAHIMPAGDEDVFAFQNTQTGAVSVKFDIWSSALGVGVPCGGTTDTVLVIRNAAAAVLLRNDDRGGAADRCSSATYVLAPGQRVYVQIFRYGDSTTIPNYVLTAAYTSLCGNGTLDSGEQCDDGNVANGDGCSATCQLE